MLPNSNKDASFYHFICFIAIQKLSMMLLKAFDVHKQEFVMKVMFIIVNGGY